MSNPQGRTTPFRARQPETRELVEALKEAADALSGAARTLNRRGDTVVGERARETARRARKLIASWWRNP